MSCRPHYKPHQVVLSAGAFRALTLREALTFRLSCTSQPSPFNLPWLYRQHLLCPVPGSSHYCQTKMVYMPHWKRWRLQKRLLSLSSGNGANTSHYIILFRDYGLQFSIEESNVTLTAAKKCARSRDLVLFVTLRLVYVLEMRFPLTITVSAR